MNNGKSYKWLIIPTWVVLGFYIIVLLFFLRFAFYETGGPGQVPKGFTLENFLAVFKEPFLSIFIRTLRISIFGAIGALLVGYPIAYKIVRTKSSIVRAVSISIVIITFLVNLLVRLYSWRVILGVTGPINKLLTFIGFSSHSFLRTETAVTIGLIYWLVPIAVLTLVGILDRISIDLENAAMSLGAGKVKTFFKVTLPLSGPGILASFLLSYCLGMSAFVIPLILGGTQTRMFANVIYKRMLFSVNYPLAAGLGAVLLTISLILIVVYQYLLKRYA